MIMVHSIDSLCCGFFIIPSSLIEVYKEKVETIRDDIGGFGGCQYITCCMQYCYLNLSIVCPIEREYAVAKGGCSIIIQPIK